jgi:hypothetical protein
MEPYHQILTALWCTGGKTSERASSTVTDQMIHGRSVSRLSIKVWDLKLEWAITQTDTAFWLASVLVRKRHVDRLVYVPATHGHFRIDQMLEKEQFFKMLVFNQALTWLMTSEYFSTFIHHESFKICMLKMWLHWSPPGTDPVDRCSNYTVLSLNPNST